MWEEHTLDHWTPKQDDTFYYVGWKDKDKKAVKEAEAIMPTGVGGTSRYNYLQEEIKQGNCYKTKKEALNKIND